MTKETYKRECLIWGLQFWKVRVYDHLAGSVAAGR